jgi:DNA-binding response OmpR family regulator
MRVLLVDDHTDGLEVTAKLLKLEGFDVLTATSCRDAVELARQERFDLLVTDLGLPDGTGMELLAELNRNCSIPGIAITAHSERDFVEGACGGGFARHLFKPFVFADLLAAVRQVAGSPAPACPKG